MAWLFLAGAWADNISAEDVQMQTGATKTVSISLTNTETNLVSFQIDLTLPEGISINKAGCSLGSRVVDPDQVLTIGKQGDNVYRLTSTSFALTPISGTSGTLLTLSLTAAEDSHGGTATLSNIVFATANSEEIAMGGMNFNIIVKAEQTLALESLPEMTYGDAAYTLPTTTEEGLTLTWTSDNATVANIGGNTLSVGNAGTATITATQEGNDDYIVFNREFTLTVDKAALTITANDCTKVGGEENPELSVSYEGFVNGEDQSVLTQQPTVTTEATTDSPVGSYPITASGAEAENYDISYVAGTLTVIDGRISAEDIILQPGGNMTVDISLTNSGNNLVSFQMDLTLPEGISIYKAGCSLSGRIGDTDQVLTIGKQGDNIYRLTSTSFALTPISGTSGALLTLSLTASETAQSGTATLSDIVFATSNSEEVALDDTSFNITVEESFPVITFADANVKAICVQNWDTDGDGELSEAEAAAVTDLGTVFKGNTTITSFDELQYFTGLTNIGNEAFRDCSCLTSVTIPSSVTSIGESAFRECSGLTSVNIPESVTSIGKWAFYHCNKLTSVTIPNSVESIGLSAFYLCSSLTSMTIPNSVTSIGNAVFSQCTSLTSITVENGNSYYVSENGVLFNKNKTSLLCFPAGKTQSTYAVPESVTEIRPYAFDHCRNLTSVTIPNSVTSIGNYAFNGCSKLTSVTIPNSVTTLGYYAFYQCTGLTSVSIGNSVTSIGMSTFRQCTSLNSITIPNSVTRIDMEAFKGCTSLTSATIPESVTSIGVQAFKDCPVLTSVQVGMESPLTIDSEAFTNRTNATLYVPAGCKAAYEAAQYWQDFNIVSLITFADANVKALCVQNWDSDGDGELSEDEAAAVTDLGTVFRQNKSITSFDELQYFTGLTIIGEEAFRSCSALTTVTIPNSVTSIGQHAFHSCFGLTTVTIPESVTGIGFAAFHQCNSLTSVTIPASVTNISGAAFGECSSLSSIVVENGNNTYISENGVLFNKDKTTIICYPAGKEQTEFTIPESVTSIIYDAFSGCSLLMSVTIPNSMTTIGKIAFQNCTGLTSVTIPNSVTGIGDGAFNGCSNLTSVTVEKETPLTIAENTFSNRANATLYVPAGCKAAYEAAQYWQDFTIEEMGSSLEPTDISQIDNVIYMEPQEVPIGSRGTLSFKMKNNAPIRGFQFDLYLPEGMTVATSSNGKVLASLDATKLAEGDSHQLTTSIQPDGAVLFLCNSQYDENFATGDDIMMTVKVNVSEDMEEGEYPVELKTVKLSETDISKYYLTELVRSKVAVGSYLLGDVNADGVVDISDYISMANYIHGNVAEGFVFRAGDIDGNGSIDISDYIGVSNIIHTGSPSGNSQAGAKAALFPSEESQEKDPE